MTRCAVIIVAAGQSRRMGFDKLAADLGGQPVLRRSVARLMTVPEVGRVVVVCDARRFESLLGGDFEKPLDRVDGGAERQDSVRAGLAALAPGEDLVAVHDGARPLVAPNDVSRVIALAARHGAAALARPAGETLKRADSAGVVTDSVEREGLWFTETPQVFQSALLHEAYATIQARGLQITDEVSAAEVLGAPVRLLASTRPNPKITIPADLELARALLD